MTQDKITRAFQSLSAELAAIDPSPEVERRDRGTENMAEMEAALAKARTDLAKVREDIYALDRRGGSDHDDGQAAQHFLTSGELAPDSARSDLEEKAARLSSVIRGLSMRLNDGAGNSKAWLQDLRGKIAICGENLADAVRDEVGEIAQRLASLYATARGAALMTGNRALVESGNMLEQVLAPLVDGRLIDAPTQIPENITNAFLENETLFTLARTSLPRSVPRPESKREHNPQLIQALALDGRKAIAEARGEREAA